jgi:hypothetical protein
MAKGDHLIVDRSHGLFTHHGIDIGDGTVVHYLEGESIMRTSKEFFARGQPIRVQEYAVADSPDVVVKRALSRLNERDYNIVFNNCEHFVTWCKTGRQQSDQVHAALAAGAVGSVLLGPLAVPALAGVAGLYGLQRLLEQARAAEDPLTARQHLASAIALLKNAADSLQADYRFNQQESDRWLKAARLALGRNREDLARAALEKRYPLKQKLQTLSQQLTEVQSLRQQIEQQTATVGI